MLNFEKLFIDRPTFIDSERLIEGNLFRIFAIVIVEFRRK